MVLRCSETDPMKMIKKTTRMMKMTTQMKMVFSCSVTKARPLGVAGQQGGGNRATTP